jgi:hypothetical protein
VLLGLAVALPLPAAASAASGPAGATAPALATSSAALVARLGSATDPGARFSQLSAVDQASVISYLSVARFGTSELWARQSGPPAARTTAARSLATGPGCWTWRWERDAYNLFGFKLWAYVQEIDWCDDGVSIVGPPQILNYGTTSFPFWTWVHAGDHVWGGAGQFSVRSWTQADFSLCLSPNLGCVQSTYPWLDMTAHANGTAGGTIG